MRCFRQERFKEFELFRAGARKDDNGYRTVYAGPYHGDYGHGIGFNDLKVIEAAGLLDGIASGGPIDADFREGWAIEAVCDAILDSAQRWTWVQVRRWAEAQRESGAKGSE